MRSLAGPGRWLATDAVRVVIAACVPLALLVADPTAAAVMLLVLGGAMLTRGAHLPAAIDAATQLVLLAAAWFAALDAYEAVAGLDLATHAAAGAVLALLSRALLLRAGLLPTGHDRRSTTARVLHSATAVVALGVLWELGEWAGHVGISSEINVGYEDTLSDLVADALGGVVALASAELCGARMRRRRRAVAARQAAGD